MHFSCLLQMAITYRSIRGKQNIEISTQQSDSYACLFANNAFIRSLKSNLWHVLQIVHCCIIRSYRCPFDQPLDLCFPVGPKENSFFTLILILFSFSPNSSASFTDEWKVMNDMQVLTLGIALMDLHCFSALRLKICDI